MSTVEQIDAKPFPVLVTYAELDPPQMQVQAGELFARLVTRHGFTPDLKVIRGHNHLSQLEAINTVDDVLSSTLLSFLDGR
jgi:acetyl esterase